MNIKWQEGTPTPVDDSYHTALLSNGKIYIGGGYGSHYRIDIYTLCNDSWSSSPINTPSIYFAMTTLNSQLITAGGRDRNFKATNKIFSLDGDHLKEYTRMITPRCKATAVGYQRLLIVAGGEGDHTIKLNSTELFDSTTGQWYNTGKLPSPHYGLKSAIVDNVLYLLGGASMSSTVLSTPLDILSSHQLLWSSQKPTPLYKSIPVSMQGRHLITVGGGASQCLAIADIHMFNKAIHSWEVIGQIPSARCEPAVVSVADNKIVVVGGYDDKHQFTNTVWIGLFEPQ